jgi:hypothetical protein
MVLTTAEIVLTGHARRGETAVVLAKPESDEKLSLEDYLDEINLIMRAFCEVYDSI